MKILIIDDHELVRRGLCALLTEQYKQVEIGQAGDARQGLAMALESDWDLVVADISLPGRSGLDLIQDIRRVKPELPVLVISGHQEKDYALRALKLGAVGYVPKQSAADVLVTAVQRALSGRRYVSQQLAEQLAGAISGDTPGASHESLSNRELEVLKHIASGKTIKEISGVLALSEKTVATYRGRIAEKMGLSTNVELTRYALQHHLVE